MTLEMVIDNTSRRPDAGLGWQLRKYPQGVRGTGEIKCLEWRLTTNSSPQGTRRPIGTFRVIGTSYQQSNRAEVTREKE